MALEDPVPARLTALAGATHKLAGMQLAYTANDLTVQWGHVMDQLTSLLLDLADQETDPAQEAASTDALYTDLMDAAYTTVLTHVEHRLPTAEEANAAMGAVTRYRLSVADEGDLPPLNWVPPEPFDQVPGDAGIHDGGAAPEPEPVPPTQQPPPPGTPDVDLEGD